MKMNFETLSAYQLELLKSLQHITDEKQLSEIKSLLHLYFSRKLDHAIDEVERVKGFDEAVYQEWLNGNPKS